MLNKNDHMATTDAGLSCVHVSGCWCRGLLMSGKFWASVVASFIAIAAFQWIWRTYVMMDDYTQTEVMWRPVAEMKPALCFLSYALQAFAYSWLILAGMRTARWRDALLAGLMIGVIGVGLAVMKWNVMPFVTTDLPIHWGLGFVIEAVLVALVVKIVNMGCTHCCAKKVETAPNARV